MRRHCIRLGWLLLGASMAALSQPQPAPLSVLAIRDGVYWILGGSGANTGLIIGQGEAVLVDAKMTPDSAQAMLEEVRKITPHPVRRVILTHSDGDHVNGLSGLPRDVQVIAHPNARRDMEEAAKDPKLAALAGWLPAELVGDRRTLHSGGVRIELIHFGPAHTDGDLVVFLPAQRVAFVGDLLFIGREPLIHRHKNGRASGVIATLRRLLELEADTYVSGHADPVGKEEIRKALASLEGTQQKVRSLIAEGKSLDEIKAAFGVQEAPAGQRRRPGLVEVIYLELTEKK